MNPDNFPEISDLLESIQSWNRNADADSYGAGTYAMFYYESSKYYKPYINKKFTKQLIADILFEVKKKMIKHFKSNKVKLGDYQKLVRGKKELPIFGLPDVITAMRGVKHKDGKIKISHGESYVGLVRFTKDGPQYESISPYGSSDNPRSPHYNDQMEMLSKFKTKKMTFEKKEIYKNSKIIYNPK